VLAAFRHVDLCVTDPERSLVFYGELLELLGWRPERRTEIVGESGERVVYLPWGDDPGMGALGLRSATADNAPVDRYRVGLHHLAFNAGSRESVDAVWEWVKSNALGHEGAPRGYYSGEYYALFIRDPDNIKVEVVYRPPRTI
jgi:glyoxylase I family protein